MESKCTMLIQRIRINIEMTNNCLRTERIMTTNNKNEKSVNVNQKMYKLGN